MIGLIRPKQIEPLTCLTSQDVAVTCQGFDLQEESQKHLTDNPPPHSFMARLLHDECYLDATRFLAYALPERDAVWWACHCVRSMPTCYQGTAATQALEAAEQWVCDPGLQSSQNALTTAKQHSFEMPSAPAAWAAMGAACAAYESTNTANPPEFEHTTAQAIAGAVALAATAEIDQARKRYIQFIEMGVVIAQGKGSAIPIG